MIFNIKKKNKKFIFFIFVIISFGIFIRFYNLNYNDMWSDEMVTFWLSDPSINLNETLNRIFISPMGHMPIGQLSNLKLVKMLLL